MVFRYFGYVDSYKCDYRSHIKQVIISCKFCQHFNCLEVVLG